MTGRRPAALLAMLKVPQLVAGMVFRAGPNTPSEGEKPRTPEDAEFRVLLVVMPFAGIERPQIGVSTLKAQLSVHGIPCDLAYFNLGFAATIGYELYTWLTNYYNYSVFAGERAFARALFPQLAALDARYVAEILCRQAAFSPEQVRAVMWMSGFVRPFLRHSLNAVDWRLYSVIGFSSTFEQNLPSLVLSRLVKQRHPNGTIVFGGGNCAGDMGRQLHESFGWVDYVFSEEADFSFPELVRRLRSGDRARDDIPGYVRREQGRSVGTLPGRPVCNLDDLPIPDYDDFFRQLAESPLSQRVSVLLPVETSRGCWWGEKHHCTFCGLPRSQSVYREKSARRALAEIEYLRRRYRVHDFGMVDNILSKSYFSSVLPELKRRRTGVRLVYETKANLDRDQLRVLREAGVVAIQPGIESLCDHQLKLMCKGVSSLQNVQLLKWSEESGLRVHWNHLYGFPGERAEDYREAVEMVPAMYHLQPPDASGPMRLDRFSPYFECPAKFGIRVRGAPLVYSYLYPFDSRVRDNLAFFWEYDFYGKDHVVDRAIELEQALERWRLAYPGSRLEVVGRSHREIVV